MFVCLLPFRLSLLSSNSLVMKSYSWINSYVYNLGDFSTSFKPTILDHSHPLIVSGPHRPQNCWAIGLKRSQLASKEDAVSVGLQQNGTTTWFRGNAMGVDGTETVWKLGEEPLSAANMISAVN